MRSCTKASATKGSKGVPLALLLSKRAGGGGMAKGMVLAGGSTIRLRANVFA